MRITSEHIEFSHYLGELSKPANTLIEKISDAIGGIFRPHQIRRLARAEAEADQIRAVSQIEVSDLQRRALHRFLSEEAKRQNNIETITQKALPQVSGEATPQNVEDDWISNFFDKCRLTSDEEMQNLWAKVLAGEANAPGKYSKRTINLLAGLDKADAEMFAKLCTFAVVIGTVTPLIYGIEHPIYKSHGVNFGTLSHLDSIGLIQFESLGGYQRKGLKENGFVYYYGTPLWIGFNQPTANVMKIGHVLLTNAGQQLAPICGSKPHDGFTDYLREEWKSFGYKVEEPQPPSNPLPASGNSDVPAV